jgi:hypothetical protein
MRAAVRVNSLNKILVKPVGGKVHDQGRPVPSQTSLSLILEHDPEKWVPVFRKRSCSIGDVRTLSACPELRCCKTDLKVHDPDEAVSRLRPQGSSVHQSMIRKSGYRFSEKIMLNQ